MLLTGLPVDARRFFASGSARRRGMSMTFRVAIPAINPLKDARREHGDRRLYEKLDDRRLCRLRLRRLLDCQQRFGRSVQESDSDLQTVSVRVYSVKLCDGARLERLMLIASIIHGTTLRSAASVAHSLAFSSDDCLERERERKAVRRLKITKN